MHRIAEVKTLRARQFPEDAGPLAHPVRPTQYREINNFYTATVYEKGAEIVRMLKTIIGDEDFRRGMDLYFERCDGTAATVEDFLPAFADVTGRDLSHFARWYAQAGTPRVTVSGHYDEAARDLPRSTSRRPPPPRPGEPTKEPMAIPVAPRPGRAGRQPRCGRRRSGRATRRLRARPGRRQHHLRECRSPPVPSLFRGFSAPVKVALDLSNDELLVLLRHDTDPFNRWQSAQTVAMRLLVRLSKGEPVDDMRDWSG